MGPRQADIDEASKQKFEKQGIEWDRSCTDIICCIIFMAFMVAMLGVSGFAISNGDPMNIIAPFDSVGNQCGKLLQGVDYDQVNVTDFSEYKYKHFTRLIEGTGQNPTLLYNAVCVKKCPKKDEEVDCKINDHEPECPKTYYDTELEFGYCLPTGEDVQEALNQIYKQINEQSNFGKYLNELQNCWQAIAVMSGVTIVISIIYVFLLKWITKPLLYVSMLVIFIAFVLLGGYCYIHMADYEKDSDNYKLTQAGAILSFVVGIAYMICVCCCWKNISLGASIMECASEFVAQNLRIVALPVVSYLIVIPVFIIWTGCAIYLYSIGTPMFAPNSFIATIEWKKETEYMFWFYLFGLLWIIAFIICVQQFMIASLACMWYYSGQGEEMSDARGEVSVYMAFRWAMWYHVGSIAMGSFLIALIAFIRIIFEYIVYQYEKVGNKENPVYKAVKCVISCIIWCLDQYVKFITKNAYIQIALHSTNFCKAAWDSFCLIIRHAGRFGSAGMIGWIMMILGKGTIVGASSALTFIFIKESYPDIQQPLIGTGIVAMVAYLVGSLFLSIFSFSCTAILHSFILAEDTKCNIASPESLQPFLDYNDGQNAKKEEQQEKPANDVE